MTELYYGRYRKIAHQYPFALLARDVETGARVLLPEIPFKTRWVAFSSTPALRVVAERIAALGDPRLLPIVGSSPVVITCPDVFTDDGHMPSPSRLDLAPTELVDLTLELFELTALAMRCGARVSSWDAWIARDASGRATVRLPAPLGTVPPAKRDRHDTLNALELLRRGLGGRNAVTGLRYAPLIRGDVPADLLALSDRVGPRSGTEATDWEPVYPVSPEAAVEALRPFASDPSRADAAARALRALDDAPALPAVDLDLAIALGERELAEKVAAAVGPDDRWVLMPIRFELAGFIHRRACLGAASGDLPAALTDARRAVEIDPHPEHLTTLALLFERVGEDTGARETHDRAVAAIDAVAPPGSMEPVGSERDIDYRSSFRSRAARTLEARGAFRIAHGELAHGEADLRASLAMSPTPSCERRLAALAGGRPG